jgi:hypothetical protein
MINHLYTAVTKIVKHRVALWKAGRKLGVSTSRLLKHDNSKFHPTEFWQYVRRFELGIKDPEKWGTAWEHHWRHNDHHIEYWEDKNLTYDWYHGQGVPKTSVFPGVWIPDEAIREIVADWMAASYAYSGSWPVAGSWEWGDRNLVPMLRRMEIQTSPEICTRGFAVHLLRLHNMITDEQVREALTL